jgi:hypothetical protein
LESHFQCVALQNLTFHRVVRAPRCPIQRLLVGQNGWSARVDPALVVWAQP